MLVFAIMQTISRFFIFVFKSYIGRSLVKYVFVIKVNKVFS